MDELINNKASGIIERLVNSNAIYLTDERNLDQEELMQVEILRMKELEKEKKKAEIQEQEKLLKSPGIKGEQNDQQEDESVFTGEEEYEGGDNNN